MPLLGSVTPKACRRNSPRAIPGKKAGFLRFCAVAQDRAHGIHLRVARTRITTRPMDFLEDGRPRRQRQSKAAKGFGNQSPKIPFLGQNAHKFCWVGLVAVRFAPVVSPTKPAQSFVTPSRMSRWSSVNAIYASSKYTPKDTNNRVATHQITMPRQTIIIHPISSSLITGSPDLKRQHTTRRLPRMRRQRLIAPL